MEIQTRRTFYSALLSGVGAIIGVGMALPAAAYLLISGNSKKKGNFVEATKLTQLQIGKPQEVTFERTR